jgi:single-strand DNA-binding protein
LATSETWKDKATGERKEKTEWHRISILSEGLVRVVQNYVKKGSKLYIEGQLETRKWQDKDGQDRYTTEVVLRGFGSTLTMLDSAGDRGGARSGGNDFGEQQGSARKMSGPSESFSPDLDDEIPF